MVLGKLPVQEQGLTAIVVGAGRVFLDMLLYLYLLSYFSLSLGDGPIWTEILSQRVVKPKSTNPPIETRQ